MTLGQRIREARLDRQMTQQELVGDYITRNMLSKIENDAAVPSVRTLEYLAAAMSLPPGAFLSDASAGYSIERQLTDLQERLEKDAPDFPDRLSEAIGQWEKTGVALRLLRVRLLMKTGERDAAAALLGEIAVPDSGHPYRFTVCLLQGLLKTDDPAAAIPFLREAEMLLEGQTDADRNLLLSALEEVYYKTGDFRLAYHYAKTRQNAG